ncbi:MAG: AbrB/MazE/SpoVT family DNA-binding domain-containing protein [Hyphomicrobiaceae bacterium]|nr:AbrB/MazE/SpoVT family DNA-binding domain-containing protein [Hyphomicrobiaceae bacterium]
MQVSRWGNSLAVRLPAKLVAELGLKEGDEVDLRPVTRGECERTVLELEQMPSVDELYDRLKKFQGRLPADYKFDREEVHRRRPDE